MKKKIGEDGAKFRIFIFGSGMLHYGALCKVYLITCVNCREHGKVGKNLTGPFFSNQSSQMKEPMTEFTCSVMTLPEVF